MARTVSMDLLVARKPGQRLFLGGSKAGDLSLGNLSQNTLFFQPEEFEHELRALGMDRAALVPQPVHLELTL